MLIIQRQVGKRWELSRIERTALPLARTVAPSKLGAEQRFILLGRSSVWGLASSRAESVTTLGVAPSWVPQVLQHLTASS